MGQQGTSKNKIVWPDIEFVCVSLHEAPKAFARHLRGRCAGETQRNRIHRYRTYVRGSIHADEVLCESCKAGVGTAALSRLENARQETVETPFGSQVKHTRTGYYVCEKEDKLP